jgi:hypothetical protein
MKFTDPLLMMLHDRLAELFKCGLNNLWFKMKGDSNTLLAEALGYDPKLLSSIIRFSQLSTQKGKRVQWNSFSKLLGINTIVFPFFNSQSRVEETWVQFTCDLSNNKSNNKTTQRSSSQNTTEQQQYFDKFFASQRKKKLQNDSRFVLKEVLAELLRRAQAEGVVWATQSVAGSEDSSSGGGCDTNSGSQSEPAINNNGAVRVLGGVGGVEREVVDLVGVFVPPVNNQNLPAPLPAAVALPEHIQLFAALKTSP